MRKISKLLSCSILLLAILALASCGKGKFHVDGTVTGAKDSLLYFEHTGLDGFNVLDSVKLDENGKFSFSGDKADNPEFYRLRIAGQIINIAIDSTETVDITAKYPGMASNYEVKNSYENSKIRELALMQMDLQARCQAAYSNGASDSVINGMVENYKKNVERNYIFKEPMKAYAYFALFQYIVINNQPIMIFDPAGNHEDNKVFGAVATSWDTFYPNSERGKNLHNITLRGMRNERIVANNRAAQQQNAAQAKNMNVGETGVIDLPLYDRNDQLHHLTDLKGQVVLLYFNAFAADGSQSAMMQLRDLYNKYHSRGFEIYMVGLDDNKSFWNQQVSALPWINVYDQNGNSQAYLSAAPGLPYFFLIDRGNNIVKNASQVKDLNKEIEALL